MKNQNNGTFAVKPIVSAIGLLFTAAGAIAAPTPNQMPGAGVVTNCSVALCTNFGGVGSPITGLVSGVPIGIDGKAVIQWGGAGSPVDLTNPAGFNIGSSGHLIFSAISANSAVLNIDASGSASQIFGLLESSVLPGTSAPAIFVANANGIVLGAGGRIVAPTGVGLIGANLNNATAKNDFIGNNSTGVSYIDVTTGQSTVTINGAINGSAVANVPASYVLLAGGDIVNTGNIFSNFTYALAGLRATATTATVNGVAGTTVNRLWDVTSPDVAAGYSVGTGAGELEVSNAASTFVNTGSISSYEMHLFGANGVRTGTAGDTNPLVGLFSDYWIDLGTASATAKTEVYNTVSGYTTNKSLGYFFVNESAGQDGDITINALTPGSQPSSIATLYSVYLFGQNIAINSTINHKLTSAGGINQNSYLEAYASKSLTTTADVGAGYDVYLQNEGTGATTIGGNVISDTDKSGGGGIYVTSSGKNAPMTVAGNLTSYADDINVYANGPLTISGNASAPSASITVYNSGTASGNVTTISGNLTADDTVYVTNAGALSSHLNVSGTLTAGYQIYVYSGGNLQLAKATAGDDIYVEVDGLSSMLNGAITSGTEIYYDATAATTKAKPAAVITAPYVYIDALTFQGVNASGAAYANVGEKPSAQIVTNSLVLTSFGSFNAPIAGNTNWLTNQIQVEALDPLSQVNLTISAMGAGFQAINIGVTGNATANSGNTYTPFNAVGLTTGTTTAGGLIGNGGSQLIVNASGNLDIWDGFTTAFFEFPGGIAFKAGGVLTQFVPVYNAWTLEALPYQGVFFEAPTINALSYIATNGNSWANWSVKPVAGAPTVYQITQPAPTTFGFVANPTAAKQNTYSLLITGTPVNTCAGFPPVCP